MINTSILKYSLFMNHCYIDRVISITLRGGCRDRIVYKGQLHIMGTFSGSLEWPLYKGLTQTVLVF